MALSHVHQTLFSRLKLSFIIAFLYVLVGTGVTYLTAYDGTIDPTLASVLDMLFLPTHALASSARAT